MKKYLPTILILVGTLILPRLVLGQSANEYLEKCKAARNDLDFAAAFEYADKAVAADKTLWTAYLARAETRYLRDRKARVGNESAADIAEWQAALSDHLQAAKLSDQNFQAYDKLILYLIFMQFKGPADRPDVKLGNLLNNAANTYYASQIAADARDVCAYYALGFFQPTDESRRTHQLAIDKFDGTHGRKCSAEAAALIARRLLSAEGDKASNVASAKDYYTLSKKIDSSVSYPTDEEAVLSGGAASATSSRGTASASPRQTTTSSPGTKSNAQSTPPRPEWMDSFEADFTSFSDRFGVLAKDYGNALSKLEKAYQDDLKYGTNTNAMYTGTRARAQSGLDAIHKLLREFIAKWGDMPPNEIIDKIKQTERSYPVKVP